MACLQRNKAASPPAVDSCELAGRGSILGLATETEKWCRSPGLVVGSSRGAFARDHLGADLRVGVSG